MVDVDEACDLGIGNTAGGACTPSCSLAACGDGVKSLDEGCDDGNLVDGDGCSASCRDENAPLWSATLDGRGLDNEWFVDVEHFEGTTFVVHHVADDWQEWASDIVAYDANGQRWSTSHGAPEAGRFDALTVTEDALLAVGQRGVVGQWQGAIAAYSHGGQAIGESLLPETEHLSAVAVAPNGDLFLGGTTRNEDLDRWFGRYALASETVVWSRGFPRIGGTEVTTSIVYRDGSGLFATGEVGNSPFLIRLDPETGEPLWDIRPLPEQAEVRAQAFGLVVTDERVIVAGRSFGDITSEFGWDTDGWVASFSHEGDLQWERFDAGPLPVSDGYIGLVETDAGSVVAAGYRHHQALATYVEWDVDAVLVEYDAQGNRARELAFDGPAHLSDTFTDVEFLGDDRFVVAGQSAGSMQAEVGLVAEFTLPASVTPLAHPRPRPLPLARPSLAHAEAPHAQTLYVNFGGASLRPGTDGRRGELPCIDGSFDYPGSEEHHVFVEAVMERVQLLLEHFDVEVVWETRPPDALPFTTVLVGGTAAQIGVDASAAGFACVIDCGNAADNELVFAFEDRTPETLANTIVHEAGHAWGLDHVVDPSAVMSPFASGTEATVAERCLEVSDETSTPACLEAHAEFCPMGQQDAYTELLARFGERRPDMDAPWIEGLPETLEVEPGEPVPFALTVEDDSGNPGVELRIEALGVVETLDPDGLDFELYLPEGEHTVEFFAVDHAGNTASQRVSVHVVPFVAGGGSSGGEDDPEPGGTDTDPLEPAAGDDSGSPQGCGCRSDQPPTPGALLFVGLLGVAIRRGCPGWRSTRPTTRRRSERRHSRAS